MSLRGSAFSYGQNHYSSIMTALFNHPEPIDKFAQTDGNLENLTAAEIHGDHFRNRCYNLGLLERGGKDVGPQCI